jgi:hypothetical protein
MGALIGRLTLGLACAIALTAMVHVATIALYGVPTRTWPIQTLTDPPETMINEATRAELLIPNLSRQSRPMILVVGASSAQEAYLPSLLEARLPGYDVHNLALAAANMTEVNQELRQVGAAAPAAWLRRSVLLICLNYANFSPDERRWRDTKLVPPSEATAAKVRTDLERSAPRCPLSCGPIATLAPAWFRRLSAEHYLLYQALTAHLPVDLVQGIPPAAKLWSLDPRLIFTRRQLTGAERATLPRMFQGAGPAPALADAGSVDAYDQIYSLNDLMGPPAGRLHAEQFSALLQTIGTARSLGLEVVVVDMPLTSWHRRTSPYFADYEAKLQATLNPLLQQRAVDLISLPDAIPDDQFKDLSHPQASRVADWTDVLVARLRPMLQTPPGSVAIHRTS